MKKLISFKAYQIIASAFFVLGGLFFYFPCSSASQKQTIRVEDFGALPDDGIDDAVAIRYALAEAKRLGVNKVIFGAGQYDLLNSDETQNFYIGVSGHDNFIFEGVVDSHGEPATWLVRHNPVQNNYYPPHLLLVENCKNVIIRNLGFDNSPLFYTAGIITEINAEASVPYVIAEILPGHPRTENMGSFVMGSYDVENRKLLAGRLTYNSIGNWQPVEGGSGRLMKLESKQWLEPDPYFRYMGDRGILGEPLDKHLPTLRKGMALFWFQSYNSAKQILFRNCNGITLDNLKTINGSGFPMEANRCNNLEAKKVVIRPEGNRLMMAQRDGFKINNCTGNVLMEDCYFEGLNDDVQNVHSGWYWVKSVSSDRRTVFFHRPVRELTVGSELGFFNYKNGEESVHVIEACYVDTLEKHIEIKLKNKVPDFVDNTVKATPYCRLPESYIVRNTVFKNVEGAGIVLKTPNAIIEDCVFEDIMNIGIQMGARYDERKPESEAGIPRNVLVRNNIFRNCGGFINRKESPYTGGWFFGDPGAISLDIDEINVTGAIFDIKIYNNRFENLPTNGIYIRDAKNIEIFDNIFEQVYGENIVVDPKTTKNINIK